MLLTRRACYGLLAAQHLAEHASEGSFSANDLAEFYGLPHEALAKSLQRLATAGVLRSHHGIRGTLAREPRGRGVFPYLT
jgi:DNA-binding IscR family transcriptional regulator